MKNIMKKLKITALLIVAVCTMAGCGNGVATLNPVPMPDYPEVNTNVGYKVSGYAKDTNGNPLEGVLMQSGKKVYAITDENGHYEISGITGSMKFKPVFYNYEFDNAEFEVTKTQTIDIQGTNAKKYMVDFATTSNNKYETPIYGVIYSVNGKNYSADNFSEAFAEDLQGKVTVTPSKEGFTFLPTSQDVYSGTTAKFKAVPNSDRYSVSGNIDVSGLTEDETIQTVQMFVDGKLATTSYLDYVYSNNGEYTPIMKYQIDGLDPNKVGGHNISYKINGQESVQRINVKSATKTADFKYYVTKTVDLKLAISMFDRDLIELPKEYAIDYDIYVYDENDVLVNKYRGRDLVEEDIVIWRGARLEIEGKLYYSEDGESVIKKLDETEIISEADMRKDYYEGSYFEVRTYPRTYRPDKD